MIDKKTLQAFLKAKISIIPLKSDKRPNVKSWQKYNKELYKLGENTDEFEAVGMVMGDINGAETLDVDQKYDIPEKGEKPLIERLEDKVELFSPGLWKKLTIATTKNGGYHLIYKVAEMGGSVKLAMRPATKKEEKEGTKQVVLLETRGQKSYILVKPSEGYEIIQGKLFGLKTITVKERDMLFACARMFDQVIPPVFMKDPNIAWASEGLTPWQDYSERGDWKSVLMKHGWKIVKESGSKIFVKRPGATSPMSGNFDSKYNLLRVFSSSSVFDHTQSYNPFSIYAMLECGGDHKQAARQLREAGYGRTPEQKFKRKDEPVDLTNNDDYISGSDDNKMLLKYARKEIKMGYSTGFPELDKHFRWKEGKYNIGAGHANLGKSTIMWCMTLVTSVLHGWKNIIYSPENDSWTIKMALVEFLSGSGNVQKMSESDINKCVAWIDQYIVILEDNDEDWSFHEVLEKAEEVMKEKHCNILLIDPYNDLEYDYTAPGMDRKFSTYEYHYKVNKVFKKWAKRTKCTVFLNLHGVTEAQRKVHSEKDGELAGHIKPLMAADAEQGGMWLNRADDFLVFHRYAMHQEMKNQTHVHVRKVKEKWSGGEPTFLDSPVSLSMKNPDFFGFYDVDNINPLKNWFKKTILGEQETKEELTSNLEEVINQIEEENPNALAEQNYARGTVFKNKVEIEEPPF